MIKNIIIAVAILLLSGCANYQVNIFGINPTEMTKGDAGVYLAGAVASIATHIAGHHLMAEIVGMEIRQEGFAEIYEGDYSSADNRWVDHGGFLFQIAVNGLLIWYTDDSYFTVGYTTATVLELVTYPILHPDDGDFHR